jgi:hypothetical protein
MCFRKEKLDLSQMIVVTDHMVWESKLNIVVTHLIIYWTAMQQGLVAVLHVPVSDCQHPKIRCALRLQIIHSISKKFVILAFSVFVTKFVILAFSHVFYVAHILISD